MPGPKPLPKPPATKAAPKPLPKVPGSTTPSGPKPLPKLPDHPAWSPATAAPGGTSGAAGNLLGGARGATTGDVLAGQAMAGNAAVAAQLAGSPPATASGGPHVDDAVTKALRELAKADPKQIKRAFGMWQEASAGDGEEKERSAGKLGKVTTTGKATVGGGGGAYGGAEVKAVDLGELGSALQVLVEAGVVLGATLELDGSIAKQLGPVALEAQASLSAFAGVAAHAKAKGFISSGEKWWEAGAGLAAKASVIAGANFETEASVSLDGGTFGAELGVEADGMAGFEAEFDGEAAIDLAKKQVTIAAEGGFHAGVRVGGAVRGKAKLYGRDAYVVRVKGDVEAGVGGEAKFKFKLSRGVLEFDLGGGVAAGLGGDLEMDNAIDFKPIGVLIMRQYSKRIQSHRAVGASELLASESPLRKVLRSYCSAKVNALELGDADNFVKIEKVQAYIDQQIDRAKLKKGKVTDLDAAIRTVVMQECSVAARGVAPTKVTVEYGKLQDLEFDSGVEDTLKKGKEPTSKYGYGSAAAVGPSGKLLREVGA